jgi:hypothetical protein
MADHMGTEDLQIPLLSPSGLLTTIGPITSGKTFGE